MRFKRGCKVEVMSREEVPITWRCAEIISGNGHTYDVRYDYYPGNVERVSRKFIRPCPPPVKDVERWVAGDSVEVFDDSSWKVASVLKVYGGDYFLLGLLGFAQELKVHKSCIRLRQCWQDGTWLVMGKDSGTSGDVQSNSLSTSYCYQNQKMSPRVRQMNAKVKLQGDDCLPVQKNAGLEESQIVSSRSLKRVSPYYSSLLDAYRGNRRKVRAIEKDGRIQRAFPAPTLEKVDAVAYPRGNLGQKYMHTSFNNKSNGYHELEKGKLNGVIGCSLARFNDSDSDACSSVGSCSVISESRVIAVPCQDTDDLCSNAESFYGSGDEEENCSLPPDEEVAESIHRLELHAYRCTLEALYASGPLSWEKEAVLTNLRINLHISNDKHLMELRNLIPSRTGTLR